VDPGWFSIPPALPQCRAVEEVVRRLASPSPQAVAVAGVSVASLLVLVGFAAAAVAGGIRPASVAAAATFLLMVAVGLYASRLGAPGRSA
jgi:hypothetical protein